MTTGWDLLEQAGVPVVLAPMAGITNRAFRRLCRESARTSQGIVASENGVMPSAGGIYVSEMVTSRALLERHPDTLAMTAMDPDESPRSVQLYGVNPDVMAKAARMLVDEDRVDHIDLNFARRQSAPEHTLRDSSSQAAKAHGCVR